ncbi:hypothetical protein [Bradyrhizobium sp. UNPA324]|nr:hypothetical protein [Bradyrhizobium sp. UNPA324]
MWKRKLVLLLSAVIPGRDDVAKPASIEQQTKAWNGFQARAKRRAPE